MTGQLLFRQFRIWDGKRFGFGDVLVKDGCIAAIGEDLSAQADIVFEDNGGILSAGLVDIHTHIKHLSDDRYGMPPESAAFPFGVTAAVDATGCGKDGAYMDLLPLDAGVWVEIPIRENRPMLEYAQHRIQRYGKYAVGYKVYFAEGMGSVDARPLGEIFSVVDRPVMVHVTGSPVPMAEYLPLFRKGDVLTHPFHGGRYTAAKDDFSVLQQAKERGVVIDLGMAGHVHTDLMILKAAADRGIFPDTISTDATIGSLNRRGGRYGLTLCMSVMRYMGMPEEEIMAAVTTRAAQAVSRPWGQLAVGKPADLAVLDWDESGASGFAYDAACNPHGYACRMTVKNGTIVYRR